MPPLLAFAHAGLFWTGLGLVAVPILIHLFFRRRHRVIRWAAMDFLLAALRKQKRRMEIENLILLLLRCAAILLLAAAVARPAWDAPALPFGGSARGVVLVVDTSASMGALFTGRTTLDRAKERAAQFLSELPEGSQVTLVASRDETAGGGPRALLENAERGDARAALAGVRLGYGANRLDGVVKLARDKLKTLRGRRLIVFVTDLQRSDWYEGTDTVRVGLRDRLRFAEAGETAPPVVLVDVGQAETANVVITDLSAEEGRGAFPGKRVEVTATLVNYGPGSAQGTLALQVAPPGDGPWEQAGAEDITLPPPLGVGPPEPIRRGFMPRVPAKGEESVRLRAFFTPKAEAADRDRLAADSERLLALPVRPPVRILPVRTYSNAMDLLQDVALVQVIEFLQPIYPQDLLGYDLSGVDIVLWADPETPTLSVEDVAKLEGFVRRGGGFLAYFGQFADEKQLALFVDGRPDPLLPARVGAERRDEQHPVQIDREEERTQAHTLFKETEQPQFFSPDVVGYVQVSGYAPEAVVAKYTGTGDPAVLEKRYGRGRVVIVTTTPDERNFNLNGSLLPAVLFYNATQYLVWESPSLRNVTVGEPVNVVLPPGTREVEVTPPTAVGGPSREPVAEGAQEFQLSDTSVPGFYRVVARGAGTSTLPAETAVDAAVNVAADEGDLRRVTAEELRRAYQGAPLEFADEGEQVLPRTARGDAGESSRAFLGAVVALLFIELLCAWRFGSRRRPGA